MPPIVVDFRDPKGIIYISGPEYLYDLYVTKNKLFDKHQKDNRTYFQFFGSAFIMSRSNNEYQERRKHVSVAFYKEKMALMLQTIIKLTNDSVQQWRKTYDPRNGPCELSLAAEVSDLITNAEIGTIFG
jgi:cytochrome P450